MLKKIVIDSTIHQMRIAIVENDDLVELFIEKNLQQTIVGNIYKGIVKNVLPGMQAVFVDIAQSKNGFLSLTDRKPKKVYPGMDILVQVEKEATGSKGAKLTDEISITGRFVVLLPNQNYIGISQKIQDENERDRLKTIANKLKPKGYGIIVRTNAQGKQENDFIDEINQLYNRSEKILSTADYIKAPAVIYKDESIVYRLIRDLLSDDIDELVINDKQEYFNILQMIKEFNIDFSDRIRYYNDEIALFDCYKVESQIEKALQKHVWLKNGGFLVIEQTEACVVIDVNTGKFTGKKNLQETIFKTNKEAAIEIAKQIRLRNLSGIIIIDFIDMASNENQRKLIEILENETRKDRVKTVVIGITQLGLIQVTRKKMRKPLSHILLDNCNCCNGSGKLKSLQFVLPELQHEIESIFSQTIYNQIIIHASKELKEAFTGNENEHLKWLENKFNKKIVFKVDNSKYKSYYRIDRN